jgi:hypothetical protein
VPTVPRARARHGPAGGGLILASVLFREIHMPVILWLLGVPLVVVLLLMLFGVL